MAPLYALLAGMVVAAALLVLLTPHMLYAALGLLCAVLGMASLYFLQGSSFVAVAHVIVYGGGVLVLVLFSTRLLPLNTKTGAPPRWLVGSLAAGLAGGCLWPLARFSMQRLQQQGIVEPLQGDGVMGLGLQLLGPYALAFEWVGLSLLIALVGAAYIMKES